MKLLRYIRKTPDRNWYEEVDTIFLPCMRGTNGILDRMFNEIQSQVRIMLQESVMNEIN